MTMKVEIYGAPQDEPEKVLRLRLSGNDHGPSISLRAVDEDGEDVPCGCLIHIRADEDGHITFTRASGVSRDLGLQLYHSQIVVK
jgi:hypothetical protein